MITFSHTASLKAQETCRVYRNPHNYALSLGDQLKVYDALTDLVLDYINNIVPLETGRIVPVASLELYLREEAIALNRTSKEAEAFYGEWRKAISALTLKTL